MEHRQYLLSDHLEVCKMLLSTQCRTTHTWQGFSGGAAHVDECNEQCDNCAADLDRFECIDELHLLMDAYGELTCGDAVGVTTTALKQKGQGSAAPKMVHQPSGS